MAGARFAAPTLGRIVHPSSGAVADDEVGNAAVHHRRTDAGTSDSPSHPSAAQRGARMQSPSRAPTAPADDQEATMSKFARALILGAMLASMNLAGMTAVAQAQVTDQHTSKQDARR